MSSQWGQQYRYAQLYSEPLPTERRGMLRPILLAVSVVALFVGLLWFLFYGPGFGTIFKTGDAPTVSDRTVTLDLASQQFFIPENYLRRREHRRGGEVEQIEIQTVWPSLKGYSEDDADAFRDKTDISRIIYMTLEVPKRLIRPAEVFHHVYPYFFSGPEADGPYGLKTRPLDPNSGRADMDVYYSFESGRFHMLHCLKIENDLMPPDCFGDRVIEPKILARYRFRRSMLNDWREIDTQVEQLLARFAGR